MAKSKNTFLPFVKAREKVQALKLKSKEDYTKWVNSKERLPVIPKTPNEVYASEWSGWGDWLGTGRVANFNKEYLDFNSAREYARKLNLKSRNDWINYHRSNPNLNVPANPAGVYKECWLGWKDWLSAIPVLPYLKYEDAKSIVTKLNIKSISEWKIYCKSSIKQLDIPFAPNLVYAKEWTSWGDWLGTGRVASYKIEYLDFDTAKKEVQKLNFRNREDWKEYIKSPNMNKSIPNCPNEVYASEWTSWGDWLGTGRVATQNLVYRSFRDARDFAKSLKLKNYKEWGYAYDNGLIPKDIPKTPHSTYKTEWNGVGDWLGTYVIASQNRIFRDFKEAREYIQAKNFRSKADWANYIKSKDFPKDIPKNPDASYKEEWISWGDWLGTYSVAYFNMEYRKFSESRIFVRKLNLQTIQDYQKWARSSKKPEDIPARPDNTYKNDWISWGDWLGNYSQWTKNALLGFIKSLYPILPNLDPSELYLILRNNNCLNAIEQLGDDSPLKRLINDTLHGDVDGIANTFAEIDKLQIPENDAEVILSSPSNEQEITAEIIPTEQDAEELPKLTPTQILNNLDHLEDVLGISDEETVQFLINKALGRLWGKVLSSTTPDDEIASIRAHTGANYSTQVRDKYLEQYAGASLLPIPAGYAFKKNNELIKPNLMQRLVAYRLLTEHRLGNWSGTGAGKTLGAILGSRVVDAKLTIIIGLNNTILDEKSGWASEIKNAFPNSNVLIKEKRNVVFSETQPNYLLLNYETFQQSDSKAVVEEILDNHQIDFIVLDEVHSAKSKNQEESKRRKLINHLLIEAAKRNPDLHVLGMSATPVVNSLDEAVSLIEMIKGREYNELDTTPKLSNALAIHAQLVINGIRYVPNYAIELKEIPIEIIDNAIASELQSIGKGQVLQIEIALLRAKLNTIIELSKPGTIIYSMYVEEIFDIISSAVKASGLRVARFNGDDKTGLELFKQGKVDVLIGSSALGTGVDGLQYVCNRLIIVCLPWTSAGYEQLLGRIYRQGSKFTEVEVFIPQVTLMNNGDSWSWDKQREARIKYKKTLADAAVDGVVPEANLASPSLMLIEAKKALNDWVARLESGELYELSRRELKVPLPPDDIKKGLHKYGDFSAMNQRFNTSKSTTMHDRLVSDPEEFYLYHSLYREARETWSEVPYQVLAEQLNKRPDWIIGDFGCGEALLSKSVRNKVYSFDHVAINPSVMACDMAHTGLDAEMLDVAVFSLSLMGVNWEDYLKEAFRLLRSGSLLKISEPASSWAENNYASLKKGIESAGFELLGEPRLSSKFIYLDAIKPL